MRLLLRTLAVVGVLLLLIPFQGLVIKTESGDVLYSRIALTEIHFSTRIRHSIHQSEVEERYVLDNSGILLVGSSFEDVGWGMPEEFQVNGDAFEIQGLNERFEKIYFRASHLVDPIIVIEGYGELDLSQLVPNHERVEIQSEKTNLMEWLLMSI